MSEPAESRYRPFPADAHPEAGEVFSSLISWIIHAKGGADSSDVTDLNINFSGEFTRGVLLVDEPYPLAIKTYGSSDGTGLLEAKILEELSRSPDPPLVVPTFLGYKPYIPGRLEQIWMSKVEGMKLDSSTVRQFSREEKQALGGKMGHFVAWMADAINPERYYRLHAEAGSPVLYDRTNSIRKFAEAARANSAMDSELAMLMLEIEAELEQRQKEELAKKDIMAHDDFRVSNITFVNKLAEGVVDLGLCRPVSPERVMRHTLQLGTEVTEAAIKSYEASSGQTISKDLLRFWAIGQVASAAASYSLVASRPRACCDKHTAEQRDAATECFENLAYLLPDRDWSGLAAAA